MFKTQIIGLFWYHGHKYYMTQIDGNIVYGFRLDDTGKSIKVESTDDQVMKIKLLKKR